MDNDTASKKVSRIENGGIHELVMIALSGFMLISSITNLVVVWSANGIGGVLFRTWAFFFLACFVFWFFTSQHVKMHKYRSQKRLNTTNAASGLENTNGK